MYDKLKLQQTLSLGVDILGPPIYHDAESNVSLAFFRWLKGDIDAIQKVGGSGLGNVGPGWHNRQVVLAGMESPRRDD